MTKHKLWILLALIASICYAQSTRLLRQPTISDTAIVFVYAADLWKVPINGGNAIRLTSDIGAETNPQFSKDGK